MIDVDGVYAWWDPFGRDMGKPDLPGLCRAAGVQNEHEFFSQLEELSVSERHPSALSLLYSFSSWSPFGLELATKLAYDLYREAWHQSHEAMGWIFREGRDPRRVEAMWWLARWIPSYLIVEEGRHLAVNMIHGLAEDPNEDALVALRSLAEDVDQNVSEVALGVLEQDGPMMSWRNFSPEEEAQFRGLLPEWGKWADSQKCPRCAEPRFRWYSYKSATRQDSFVWYAWCSACKSYSGQTSHFPSWDLPDPLVGIDESTRSAMERGLEKWFAELDRLWDAGELPQVTEQR